MSTISNILKFYKDCYAFDYRSVSVRNFFGRSARHVYVVENLELLKEIDFHYLVENKWGEKVMQELALNSKELGLYVGAFFVMGKAKQLGRQVRVAPPLYLYEANLTNKFDKYRVKIDIDNPIVNPYFLEFLKSQHPEVSVNYEEFVQGLPSGPFGVFQIVEVQKWLGIHLPFLDISTSDLFYNSINKLENPRLLYKQNSAKEKDRLISGACIAMLKKQEGSMGVINELEELATKNDKQSPLTRLFKLSKLNRPVAFPYDRIDVPFTISSKQEEAFKNAVTSDLSMVIGPPGTGKSYTIAALVAFLISENKTVLVASKNSQAGKVVIQKLENDGGLTGLAVKAGRKSYKYHLSNKIQDILSGMQSSQVPTADELSATEIQLGKLNSEIASLETSLIKREKEEYKWGVFFANNKDGFFQKFKQRWIEYQHDNASKIWEIKSNIDKVKKRQKRLIKKYIKAKHFYRQVNVLRQNRKDVANFSKTLVAETGQAIDDHFQKTNFTNVLKALPAWVINTNDAHHILPLEKEIFDVLVIDEATQCEIASCLPLIYRAKSTVIIGDPKQLRHISFLSKAREQILNQQYGIDNYKYRDYSILDLVRDQVRDQSHITFLNEHYRSFPDIIEFSNRKFYNGSLYLMTDTPITRLHKNLFLINTGGSRNPKGENVIEAQAIIEKMDAVIGHEAKLDKSLSSKIGIISPFRAQVNLLKSMVRDKFKLEHINKHEILIGTPFHFQGEERDVILLSFVIDKKTSAAANNYINRPDVFNVSITRARGLQIVYNSISSKDLNETSLLYEYFSHIESPRNPKVTLSLNADLDGFTNSVCDTIENWGVDRIYKSYAISGVVVDLVVVHEGRTHCIDLIGYPSPNEPMYNLTQLDMLDRMGHKVFFMPYSEWYLNREVSIESLHDYIFKS